jgi:hypothetical protein
LIRTPAAAMAASTRARAPRRTALTGAGLGVGLAGIEPATSPLSGVRSNRLSYSPGISAGHRLSAPADAVAHAASTAHPYAFRRLTDGSPCSTLPRGGALVGQAPRPNVAGHRFAWCSAGPAQRFYSTPFGGAQSVREGRSQGPSQGDQTMDRTTSAWRRAGCRPSVTTSTSWRAAEGAIPVDRGQAGAGDRPPPTRRSTPRPSSASSCNDPRAFFGEDPRPTRTVVTGFVDDVTDPETRSRDRHGNPSGGEPAPRRSREGRRATTCVRYLSPLFPVALRERHLPAHAGAP